MDLTSLLLLKNGFKNIPEDKLPKKVENILLKKILIELDAFKSIVNKFSIEDKVTKQNLQKLENFKPTFKNISSLDKLLDEILKNIPDKFQQKSYVQENIANLKTLINKICRYKTVHDMAFTLKNEVALLFKIHPKNSHIEKFLNKFENFLKQFDKDVDMKILQSSFKEVEKAFSRVKNNLTLTKHNENIILSIEKKIDTISLKVFLKNSTNEEIKQFDTLLKEIILANKSNKIRLANKQTLMQNIGNITKNLDEISSMIPDKQKFISVKQELKNFIQNIQNIDLKKNIINSGVFYEAKLTDLKDNDIAFDEISKKDIKAILLKFKNDESLQNNKSLQTILDKTINQINTVQTNALLSHTFLTYIPFGWQELKDGYFSISKLKNSEGFSCKIELDLHKQGKIDILMLFHKELLSVKMDIKNIDFKNTIQNQLSKLKKSLNRLGFQATIFFAKEKKNSYSLENIFHTTLDMDIKA